MRREDVEDDEQKYETFLCERGSYFQRITVFFWWTVVLKIDAI